MIADMRKSAARNTMVDFMMVIVSNRGELRDLELWLS